MTYNKHFNVTLQHLTLFLCYLSLHCLVQIVKLYLIVLNCTRNNNVDFKLL